MLIECQICSRTISDSAKVCPSCASPPEAFLGAKAECTECGQDFHAAYQTCLNCGAPRSIALAPLFNDGRHVALPITPANNIEASPLAIPGSAIDDISCSSAPASKPTPKAAKKSRGSLVGGVLAGLAVLGAAAAWITPKLVGGAIGYTSVRAVRSSSPATPTQAELDKLWTRMESDPDMGPFLNEFRTSFPAEQDRFTEAFVQHAKTSTDRSQDARVGYDFMRSFVAKNSHIAAQASDQVLDEMADQAVKIGQLLQKADVAKCAAYAIDGDIGPSMDVSKELRRELGQSSLQMLRAIKSGKLNGVRRAEPTEAQFVELGDAMLATGMDPLLLEALGSGSLEQMSDADKCSAGIATLAAMAGMPPKESAFWMAYNFAEGAKTIPR